MAKLHQRKTELREAVDIERGCMRLHVDILAGDQRGASLIEYSLVISIIIVITIASLVGVGAWIGGLLSSLPTTLGP